MLDEAQSGVLFVHIIQFLCITISQMLHYLT